MNSIYKTFLGALLRNVFKMLGGALVARGLVDDGLMQEVAAGAALIVVTTGWDFWRLHRQAIYQRLIAVIGIEAPAHASPEAVMASAKHVMKGE